MTNLPSIRQLRHLTALYDHRHFGRAAEACHVTQSTLSASIKELESVLQVTLVDRSKRSVVLTPVGVETVERARKIIKEVEDLVSFTTASHEPLSGTLRMGTIPTIGPFLLPRVLPGLRETYRRLKLYLVEDLTDRLIASLHRGELDVVCLHSRASVARWRPLFCSKILLWSDCRAGIGSPKKMASNLRICWARTCYC